MRLRSRLDTLEYIASGGGGLAPPAGVHVTKVKSPGYAWRMGQGTTYTEEYEVEASTP